MVFWLSHTLKLLELKESETAVRGFTCRVDPTCKHTTKTPGGRLKHEKKHDASEGHAPRIRLQSQKEFFLTYYWFKTQ